jgi:hypothetical protein
VVADDDVLISIRDREGREVACSPASGRARFFATTLRWQTISRLSCRPLATRSTSSPDAMPGRERLYRHGAGPSRWLLVVVSFEQQPGRVITALANRKDPKLWKP